VTAYEVGYSGVIRNRATVSAAVYWNTTRDGIYFTPNLFYTPASPPPTWPALIPPQALGILASLNPPVLLPSRFTYLNVGRIKDKGLELGVDAALNRYVNVFTNYSFQAKPVAEELPPGTTIDDINWPAKNRFNAGFDFSYARFLGNMAVSYTGEAYWQDVLDLRYAGTTEAYTLVNGGVGVRWAGDRLVTSLKITNLANQEVLQHIFGDVLKRQVVGEVRVKF
jgi:outer membrane receptor protein involved in Fe transport